MFPAGSGVGSEGPDHLTFDLADESKVSLSFYGKRPGPGMKLDKLSMQFSTQETESVADVLEAYERLILDAMRGDHTLFTTAEGIESLWARSTQLLEDPPQVKSYPVGTWGPNAIHQLIAPNAWRLPFERAWREKKKRGLNQPPVRRWHARAQPVQCQAGLIGQCERTALDRVLQRSRESLGGHLDDRAAPGAHRVVVRGLRQAVGADTALHGQRVQHALLDQRGHGAVHRGQVRGRSAGRGGVEDALVDVGDGQMAVDRFQNGQHRDP